MILNARAGEPLDIVALKLGSKLDIVDMTTISLSIKELNILAL